MALKRIAASSTVFANGPIWSKLDAIAMSPERETAPYVGFKPTTPQKAAGWRMEPPVSEPSAADAQDAPPPPPPSRPTSRPARA